MGFADTMITGATVVSSSSPLLVGEYFHTSTYGSGDNGDPSLMIIPSVDQFYNDFTFFISDNPVFTLNKVVIAAKQSAIGSISLDGQPLPSIFTFTPVSANGNNYGILELAVTPGSHRLTSTSSSSDFAICGYGLGWVVSYGYTAGSLLVPKQGMIINQQGNNLGSGASGTLHLTSSFQPSDPIPGTVKIYHHPLESVSNGYTLTPATQKWTYYPASSAGVSEGNSASLNMSLSKNPFAENTNLSFSLPKETDVELLLTDELGRTVRTIMNGNYAPGPYNIRLERTVAGSRLVNGSYLLTLQSKSLGIRQTIKVLALE
jgi:hypothetical protein